MVIRIFYTTILSVLILANCGVDPELEVTTEFTSIIGDYSGHYYSCEDTITDLNDCIQEAQANIRVSILNSKNIRIMENGEETFLVYTERNNDIFEFQDSALSILRYFEPQNKIDFRPAQTSNTRFVGLK